MLGGEKQSSANPANPVWQSAENVHSGAMWQSNMSTNLADLGDLNKHWLNQSGNPTNLDIHNFKT